MYPRFPFFPGHFLLWLIPIAAFALVLKGMALWRAARRGESTWFIALCVINSLGILPLIYLMTHTPVLETKRTSKKN